MTEVRPSPRRTAVFDALAAGGKANGPAVHALEVLRAWAEHYPDDRVVVVCDAHFAEQLHGTGLEFVTVPAKSTVGRILGQWLVVPWVARRYPSSAVVASVPVLSPFLPRNRCTVTYAHDWRHLTNPEEFTAVRRLYRKMWLRSVRKASFTCCISTKTLRETASLAPEATLVLCPNGCDHVTRWTGSSEKATPGSRVVLAFGHRPNKRPHLSLEAFITATGRGLDPTVELVIIGTPTDVTEQLSLTAQDAGIINRCSFPGHVADDRYQQLVLDAEVVMLPSSDEGFGLPVGEALFLGKRAVVTSDSGLEEVFQHEALLVVEPSVEALAEAMRDALSPSQLPARAETSTWRANVKVLRSHLVVCGREA